MTGALFRTEDTSSIDSTEILCDTTFGPTQHKPVKCFFFLFVNICVPMLRFLTSPENVDPRQQLLSHRVQVCGLGHSGSAK